MAVNQNQALFSLLGTVFGGNGTTTFGLPDYRGRTPLGRGTDPGSGVSYNPGQTGGLENVTLQVTQIPQHIHYFNAQNSPGLFNSPSPPAGSNLCAVSDPGFYYVTPDSNLKTLATDALSTEGGSQPHANMQPSLVLRFSIALQGVFPSRN
ncbi:microcystin-dependent protein [Rheinheimera pacifica]|nr:microcystin-dependent protein [Rheinheimera pacifica]